MGAGASYHVDSQQKEIWRQQRIKRQEIKEQQRKVKKAEQEAKKAERERIRLERGEPAESAWWHFEWWKQHGLKWPWQWWRESKNRRVVKKSRPGNPGRDYELLGVRNPGSVQTESTEEILKASRGMPHAEGELRRRK
jgi:hypothetical protein